jgi:hypothetical protein
VGNGAVEMRETAEDDVDWTKSSYEAVYLATNRDVDVGIKVQPSFTPY